MSDDEAEYGLVMPFVAVQSNGGPYDDDAYVAMRHGASSSPMEVGRTIHTRVVIRRG